MRKKDILYPFVSTAILFSMLAFLSCAHKARVQGQDDKAPEATADASSPDSTGATNDDLSQLTDNNANPDGAVANNDAPPSDGLTDGLDGKPSDPSVATNDVNPQDSLANSDLGSLDNNAAATTPTEPSSDLNNTIAQNETPITPDASPEAAPTPAPAKEWKGSRVPTIPTSAIQRKGSLLNRFYFARQGDSAESVSELIYGSSDRASDLMKWNASKLAFKPGRIVYYQSASTPQDEEMKSYYQEKNITPEDYVVKKGDWLSRIAQQKYGSSDSWKEVAVINGMSSPDALNVGQKLAMYPVDLKVSHPVEEQKVVEAPKQEAPQPQQQALPDLNTQAPQANAQQMNNQTLPPPSLPEGKAPSFGENMNKPKPRKNEGLDIAKLIEQNLFAVAMGGLVLLLVVALTAVNRRRRARNEELGDDVLPISARRK